MERARWHDAGAWMLRAGWALGALFAVHSLTRFGGEAGDTALRLWVYRAVLLWRRR